MESELERSGIIWEPRVLWDVARIDDLEILAPNTNQVQFDKYNFRNGGQYPIELRHLVVAPVAYTFDEYDGQNTPATEPTGDYGACAAVIQKSSLMISVPNRQHYALEPIKLSTWLKEPTADVSMRYSSSSPGSSGLHNLVRWNFDKDRRLILPRGAACTFQLGALNAQPSNLLAQGVTYNYNASIAFYEEGVMHGGSRNPMFNAQIRTAQLRQFGVGLNNPAVAPWQPADGLGASTDVEGAEWPGLQALRFEDYKLQEMARDGHCEVTGYSVALQQIVFDDTLIASGLAAAAAGRVASIAHRVPCRARCDAMSQEWWWREGAPLSLVCPSITPALVYRLPKPIVLHKGDHIEVEMETPGGFTTEDDDEVFSIFQVGVAFAGYAAIEG